MRINRFSKITQGKKPQNDIKYVIKRYAKYCNSGKYF